MTRANTLDRTSDETAIRDLFGRMDAAWAAHDADSFADLYTEEATVVAADSKKEGKDAIRAFMVAGFAGRLKGTTSVEEQQRIRFATNDVAIVNSLSGIVLPGGTAVRPDLQRLATWVLARTENGWLVEAYHNCVANKN